MAVNKKTVKALREEKVTKAPVKKAAASDATSERSEKAEKKKYSKEEEEILKRKRMIETDESDELEITTKKVKKNASEEDGWEDPRSYDKDEYFYEDASGDDKYM